MASKKRLSGCYLIFFLASASGCGPALPPPNEADARAELERKLTSWRDVGPVGLNTLAQSKQRFLDTDLAGNYDLVGFSIGSTFNTERPGIFGFQCSIRIRPHFFDIGPFGMRSEPYEKRTWYYAWRTKGEWWVASALSFDDFIKALKPAELTPDQ